MNLFEWLLMSEAPGATISIMLLCMFFSFLSSSVNRLLITKLIGWNQYKTMQKEMAEHRSQTTKALRSKDTQLAEKLKKREPQILNMQKQMAKPQLSMFVISMSYLVVWWFILIPTYGANVTAVIPGFGGVGVFWWYFICSLFFGTLASRILGIMPIE